MIQLQPISQRGFIRGVNAAVNRFTQPKGSVPRAINLLATRRGSLRTMDGWSFIVQNTAVSASSGFHAIAGFIDTHDQNIPAPVLCGLTVLASGTSFAAPSVTTYTDETTTAVSISNNFGAAVRVNHLATYTLQSSGTVPYQVGQIVSISGVSDATFNVTGPILAVGPSFDSNQNPLQITLYNSSATNTSSQGGTVAIGALTPGQQYFYKIVGVDTSGNVFNVQYPTIDGGISLGATTPGTETSHTLGAAKNALQLTWTTIPAMAGYRVYRSTTTNTEVLVSGYIPNPNNYGNGTSGTMTWVDLGQTGDGSTPPGAYSLRSTLLYIINNNTLVGYNFAPNAFAYANVYRAAQPPYGTYFGNSVGNYSDAWSPFGGILGTTSGIPQFVPIVDNLVICLGNSTPPFLLANGATATQINSTFVQAIPAFQASQFYAAGELVVPNASPQTGFYYKVTQQGTASTEPATWPATINGVVTSGTVQFQAVGKTTSGGTNVNGIAGPPPPGAAVGINYAGFLWVGNTYPTNHPNGIDGPSAIRMSDLSNPNSWNPVNAAFLGKDDGTEITGFAQFTIAESGIIPTGSLVVFKEYSTYQITGVFGSTNFTIQQAQTNLGCIASKTIQFIPGYGIVRLTHLGWAVFDGVRDRIIGEELRPYLWRDNETTTASPGFGQPFGDISPMDWGFAWKAQSAQTANPPMYMTMYTAQQPNGSQGIMLNAAAFDLTLRSWAPIVWPAETKSTFQLYALPFPPVTYIADAFGNILRWQANDELFFFATAFNTFTSSLVNWMLRCPDVNLQVPSTRFIPRRMILRGNNWASAGNFTVPTTLFRVNRTPGQSYQGNAAGTLLNWQLQNVFPPQIGNQDFELDVGIPQLIADDITADISGTGRFDIDGIDWFVQPKAVGVPITIT